MKKFIEHINQLDASELVALHEFIKNKQAHEEITKRLEEIGNPMLVCPVCEIRVSEEKDLMLVFGPQDLRQKARFCGYDCLSYFLQQRRDVGFKQQERRQMREEKH